MKKFYEKIAPFTKVCKYIFGYGIMIVLFAGAGWPCTFRWFAAMRVAPLDRFSARIGCLFCKAGKSVEKNEKEIQKE